MSSSSSSVTTAAMITSAAAAAAVVVFGLLRMRGGKRETKIKEHDVMTRDEFNNVHFEAIKNDLLKMAKEEFEMPSQALGHLKAMLDYTVLGGKATRGLTVVHTVQALHDGQSPLSANDMRRAAALGWTIEWMQASFLVADDMMDSSLTRRGAPCWYLVPGIGKTAINDALILLTMLDMILVKHVAVGQSTEFVTKLRNLLMETTFETELGQLLDLTTQPPGGPVDLTPYTMERYRQIVKYKTAFYSFVTPVQLGMVFVGIKDPDLYRAVREICLVMGEYFQIQDDVLDCYGDPAVIGKIGTDIEDAKCSWLMVQALTRSGPEDLAVLRGNYGKSDPKCVANVKAVFAKLKLHDAFLAYEESTASTLRTKIAHVHHDGIRKVLDKLLRKIYKRDH